MKSPFSCFMMCMSEIAASMSPSLSVSTRYEEDRAPGIVSISEVSIPAFTQLFRIISAKGSSPTAVTMRTFAPSQARFSAIFLPTPPGHSRTVPGLESRMLMAALENP